MLTKTSKYLFCQNIHNLAFRSMKNGAPEPTFSSTLNRQKLNQLADVIKSLPNIQMLYLQELQHANLIAHNKNISDAQVISFGEQQITMHEYLYQQKWMTAMWKDTHLLTTLFSSDGDQQSEKDGEEVVKQIYQFELTSVDAGQKIKAIKVLRQTLGLGLKEAKQLVDKAPTLIKKGKKEEGQKLKQELAKSGCIVTLK